MSQNQACGFRGADFSVCLGYHFIELDVIALIDCHCVVKLELALYTFDFVVNLICKVLSVITKT